MRKYLSRSLSSSMRSGMASSLGQVFSPSQPYAGWEQYPSGSNLWYDPVTISQLKAAEVEQEARQTGSGATSAGASSSWAEIIGATSKGIRDLATGAGQLMYGISSLAKEPQPIPSYYSGMTAVAKPQQSTQADITVSDMYKLQEQLKQNQATVEAMKQQAAIDAMRKATQPAKPEWQKYVLPVGLGVAGLAVLGFMMKR